MAHLKRGILLILCGLLILTFSSQIYAIPPDFNADRRINIRCPVSIESESNAIETDGLMTTLKRLYHELDDNLKASFREADNEYGEGYVFSNDPNEGIFFVAHAKASFPAGRLDSLKPALEIQFQEVFFITRIDWKNQELEITRQRDKSKFSISVVDFEKGFIWHNALLDKQRAYIPIYGFLSLPGEADEFPTIWNSWEQDKKDTATPPESLVDYDFYKVLDYKDGYYLLAKDFYEFDYRNNIEDFGIIGWVDGRYITLWRSRLYYHPVKHVEFYDDKQGRALSKETGEINRFYVDHLYLKERLFSDIVEKLDQESLHRFYDHFGFPQLGDPEYTREETIAEVFIPGAFTPRLMRLLNTSMKRNLNIFFLLDVSESMRPFVDYIKSFNSAVSNMDSAGIALRMNRIYAYRDMAGSDLDVAKAPGFERVRRAENLAFAHKSGDINYSEPLMRSLEKVLDEIEKLQNENLILPLQEKLLFIITDAGPNDFTEESFDNTRAKAKELNLKTYFIYPDGSGVKKASSSLMDTPDGTYEDLTNLISRYESGDSGDSDINFRKFKFESGNLLVESGREQDFSEQHNKLLGALQTYMDHIFTGSASGELPKDVVLYFSDERLLTEMRKWSDRRIQVLNHVKKYIKSVDDVSQWEERVAIPASPVEAFLREIRSQNDVSLSDLKKLIIINSLVSVDDIDKCRKLYDHIKPLIEMKTSQSADDVFYRALIRRDPGEGTTWNKALGEDSGPLAGYLSEREFHLNSFNQAVQRKFMYIKVDELYSGTN